VARSRQDSLSYGPQRSPAPFSRDRRFLDPRESALNSTDISEISPDDGADYSQDFRAVDEGGDVFVAPDGTTYDLKSREVDLLIAGNLGL
jgi:hypothetical protein